MISAIISRIVILVFGTLYPAYSSYKAVRTKNVKEYVKWMMYWIVFALFTCLETFTDIFLAWFPFYYEVKIIIVLWLLSPATKGSSTLYRKFVHPMLTKREQEIDEYIAQAKEKGYTAVLQLGSKGVNYATNVIMQTALKTFQQGGLPSMSKTTTTYPASSSLSSSSPSSSSLLISNNYINTNNRENDYNYRINNVRNQRQSQSQDRVDGGRYYSVNHSKEFIAIKELQQYPIRQRELSAPPFNSIDNDGCCSSDDEESILQELDFIERNKLMNDKMDYENNNLNQNNDNVDDDDDDDDDRGGDDHYNDENQDVINNNNNNNFGMSSARSRILPKRKTVSRNKTKPIQNKPPSRNVTTTTKGGIGIAIRGRRKLKQESDYDIQIE